MNKRNLHFRRLSSSARLSNRTKSETTAAQAAQRRLLPNPKRLQRRLLPQHSIFLTLATSPSPTSSQPHPSSTGRCVSLHIFSYVFWGALPRHLNDERMISMAPAKKKATTFQTNTHIKPLRLHDVPVRQTTSEGAFNLCPKY